MLEYHHHVALPLCQTWNETELSKEKPCGNGLKLEIAEGIRDF